MKRILRPGLRNINIMPTSETPVKEGTNFPGYVSMERVLKEYYYFQPVEAMDIYIIFEIILQI